MPALSHSACWSHCIDLILDFMGPAATITGLATQAQGPCMGTEGVANVTAALRMQNDAVGTIIGTCAIDFKLPLYELTLAFERGRITFRLMSARMAHWCHTLDSSPSVTSPRMAACQAVKAVGVIMGRLSMCFVISCCKSLP